MDGANSTHGIEEKTYNILVENPERKRPLVGQRRNVRIILK
jgi:hypothetical protein